MYVNLSNSIGETSSEDQCTPDRRPLRGSAPERYGTGQAAGTAARQATAVRKARRGQSRSYPFCLYIPI